VSSKRRGVDHELRVGALAHFEDPAYYASAYRRRTEDVAYYVALAERHGGPVLEYGCGSGRIAIPMARAGVDVLGVDHSAPMLRDLEARLARETKEVRARVKSLEGDMRTARVRRKFPLILCTFNTFLHLYDRDDVERFLARVKAHLAPRGRFVFDVSVPSPIDLSRDPSRAYRGPTLKHPTLGVRCKYQERFDYDPIRQILFVSMEFAPEDGRPPFVTPLAHRQFFPAELEALLAHSGFVVEKREGGFDGEPLDRFSDVMVLTCRARARS
jgi:SAM-dependent methyltransferase